jgi:hypothetical protein
MGHEKRCAQAQGGAVTEKYEPQYQYPGQWFDEMGSLIYSFQNTGMGWDLATSHLDRSKTDDLAKELRKAKLPMNDA